MVIGTARLAAGPRNARVRFVLTGWCSPPRAVIVPRANAVASSHEEAFDPLGRTDRTLNLRHDDLELAVLAFDQSREFGKGAWFRPSRIDHLASDLDRERRLGVIGW